jgi:hypothetical protein
MTFVSPHLGDPQAELLMSPEKAPTLRQTLTSTSRANYNQCSAGHVSHFTDHVVL